VNKLIKLALAIILIVWICAAAASAATADEAAIIKLSETFNLDAEFYRVDIISNDLKTVEIDPKQLTLRPLTQKEPLGRYTVKAVLYDNGKEIESGQIRFEIHQFADVLVALERAGSRQILGAAEVEARKMDITNLRETPLVSVDALAGHRTKRNISPGQIITRESIEPIPDVEPGRDVTIVYVDGLCRITSKGTAMQQGMIGDYVKVKNKTSGKVIIARVVDAAAVAIDP